MKIILTISKNFQVFWSNLSSFRVQKVKESGAGFAVVAEEITKLSSQSNTSVNSIRELIEQVTSVAATASKTVTDNVESFKKQSDIVDMSAKGFKSTLEELLSISEKIKETDTAIKGLTAQSNLLKNDINNINEMAMAVSASSEELNAGAETQNELLTNVLDSINTVSSLAVSVHSDIVQIKVLFWRGQ